MCDAFPDGYEGISKAGVGLGKVARISSYRGFVFGSMATEGPTLEEHLGGAKAAIDQLCDNSPTGEVELTAGFLQHRRSEERSVGKECVSTCRSRRSPSH